MERLTAEQLEIGKWYKDNEKDFIKVIEVSLASNTIRVDKRIFLSQLQTYRAELVSLTADKYTFQPMSITDMKNHLPVSEWWVEETSDLFPIY
jgi:hypothetical protein